MTVSVPTGKKPFVGVRQLPHREPDIRLTDQREYDTPGEKLWLKMFDSGKVHHHGEYSQLRKLLAKGRAR